MEYPDRVQFFIDKGFTVISHTPPNYQHCRLINKSTNIYAETVVESAMISYIVPNTLFVISSGWFQNMHPNFDKLFYLKLVKIAEKLKYTDDIKECPFGFHEEMAKLGFKYCNDCGDRL